MSSFLSVRSLRKSFPSGDTRLEVIRDLSLELEPGAMLAVTGESGSGKSTFLHLVGGMEPPDAGEIVVGGEPIWNLPAEDLARFRNRTVGFVFQFHHLLPEFTALENVMFPLLLRGTPMRDARERARELLAELGLEGRAHHQPGELSGGEQQRVALARALVGQPRLLLADEPTGNLDARTAQAVHRLLAEVHQRFGLTSVIVTHNPELAAVCHRQCRLEDGRLHLAV